MSGSAKARVLLRSWLSTKAILSLDVAGEAPIHNEIQAYWVEQKTSYVEL